MQLLKLHTGFRSKKKEIFLWCIDARSEIQAHTWPWDSSTMLWATKRSMWPPYVRDTISSNMRWIPVSVHSGRKVKRIHLLFVEEKGLACRDTAMRSQRERKDLQARQLPGDSHLLHLSGHQHVAALHCRLQLPPSTRNCSPYRIPRAKKNWSARCRGEWVMSWRWRLGFCLSHYGACCAPIDRRLSAWSLLFSVFWGFSQHGGEGERWLRRCLGSSPKGLW